MRYVFIILLMLVQVSFGAIGTNLCWECRATATAANVNGAGFDPENASFSTDLITSNNTANIASPQVFSATYNFVNTDTNAYLFIKAGTSANFGWYKITATSGNTATIDASVGNVVLYTSGANRTFTTNTTAGCGTIATISNATWSIDYTQQNTARVAAVADFNAVGASTTLTSATAGFTPAMVGSVYHQTTTGTGAFGIVGWYEIMTYVNATTVTLDRTPNTGTASVNCTGYIGGAASLSSSSGATDDAFFENGLGLNGTGAHVFFIKNGAYTAMGSISISASGGTQAPIRILGYNANRCDGLAENLEANRPTLTFAANSLVSGANWDFNNLIITGTGANVVSMTGANCKLINDKVSNTSITSGRNAVSVANAVNAYLDGLEVISYRGNGIGVGGGAAAIFLNNSYVHNCVAGFGGGVTTGRIMVNNSIFADNALQAFNFSGAINSTPYIQGCTIYGAENKLGTGIMLATGSLGSYVKNNIFYGLATPVNHADVQSILNSDYNDYFNNTNPNTNYPLGKKDIALDPTFANITQRTGATATTTAGNHLVQSGATFQTWGITAGTDILYLVSGTGTSNVVHYSISTVDSETQITTGETLIADATANHVWQITQGHNFGIGTNLTAKAFPGPFPGALSTGYLDLGAVQRVAPAASTGTSGGAFTFSQ